MVGQSRSIIAIWDSLHSLQIIIYDLDVIRPLTAMILTLYVANLLRSLSFVLPPARHYVLMIYYGLTTVIE